MKKATLDQGMKILELFKEVPCEQVQGLLSSGLLADLRDGNIARVDRNAFREMVGLVPFDLPHLTPLDPVTISSKKPMNPHEFFTMRKGLWVSGQAKDLFLSAASDTVSLADEITIAPFTLTERANDKTIRDALPENHVFGACELAAILAHLVESQWGGKSGVLNEKNCNWNLFYVKGKDDQVYVVSVDWHADCREWYVNAWELDGGTWRAGHRIFSRHSTRA